MRYISGAFRSPAGARSGTSWQPRGGTSVYEDSSTSIWTTEYEPEEVRSASLAPGADLWAIGCCLATESELATAVRGAADGEWGRPTRLVGSYLSVVRCGSTVRIAGDRAGTVTVYWLLDGETARWSTAAAPLAALAGAEPDPAVALAAFAVRGVDVLADRSHFRCVQRVPPGHALVLQPGRQPHTEPVPHAQGQRSLPTGAPVVREAVTAAVARRVEGAGRISSDLSGGIDSSTVTSLAAAHSPLLAVTFTDEFMEEQDDVLYARRVAADRTSITHELVHGSDAGVRDFDGLDDPSSLPFTDTPSFTLGVLAIKTAQLAPVSAYGSRMHLTGRGGDDVLAGVPTMLIDQYRAGRRWAAVSHTVALARARRRSVNPLLRQATRTRLSSYPQALAVLADRLSRNAGTWSKPPGEMLSWCGATAPARWLTRAGRAAVAELVAARAATADPHAGPGQVHQRLALELMGDGHATYDAIARRLWGIPIHAPFLDSQVVDAAHAIPGWERGRPGDFKPLARAAFASSVPSFLLQRRTKTEFTASGYHGLRANATTLRRILSRSRLAQAGLLDPAQALAALDGSVRGEPAPLAGLNALLITELWLTTLPTSPQTWWEKAAPKEALR
ncbi:albusnodin/ikarugamycin family macrolactam cyclase [Streptomyces sp. G-5]|uniref:albusnodin/ikarugamycin family macrolactam cyclase n=1 Tax=Streptomyces sp. G-5 TaxID=2977231 RepID=UPI0021D22F20|nr:albusnodin/ikarugamycin family macrolactam cyclase [Streptomyces sp. G-5]MCU4750257.1 albusnodin/ikarugamycin family macrolactam cyclase [Streptomyces sp. G-5]